MASLFVEQLPFLAIFGSSFFIIVGVIFIGNAVLDFFVGRGLWLGQNWARIVAIAFAGVGIISSFYALYIQEWANGFFLLLYNGAIGGYLWFHPTVKKVFD